MQIKANKGSTAQELSVQPGAKRRHAKLPAAAPSESSKQQLSTFVVEIKMK